MDPLLADVTDPDPGVWDFHLQAGSPLIDAGDPTLLDPDGSLSDIGSFGGPTAGSWDLDHDGYPEWWQPGEYDPVTYPAQGWDCNDRDAETGPDDGC